MRSTTLLTRDEVTVTVPNAVLNASTVTNESAPQRRRRIRVPIGVASGTDVDAFEALAVEVSAAEPPVLDSPKPRARFRSFGDSALRYEPLCRVSGPTRRRRAQHRLNRALYVVLGEADVEVSYPKRDVTPTGALGATAAASPAAAPGAASDAAPDARPESIRTQSRPEPSTSRRDGASRIVSNRRSVVAARGPIPPAGF